MNKTKDLSGCYQQAQINKKSADYNLKFVEFHQYLISVDLNW